MKIIVLELQKHCFCVYTYIEFTGLVCFILHENMFPSSSINSLDQRLVLNMYKRLFSICFVNILQGH